MKIYNTKGFEVGVIMVLLGGFYAMMTVIHGDASSFLRYFISVLLIAMGFYSLFRSMDTNLSEVDLEKSRNKKKCNVSLKSKACTLRVTRVFMFVLGLPLVIIGTRLQIVEMQAFGIALALCWNMSLFFELICIFYYEFKKA